MSSSLSDQEWKLIEPLLCRKEADLSATVEQTSDSDGIFYQLKTAVGVTYPEICPPDNGVLVLQTVARNWSFRRDYGQLHGKVREQAQKNRSGQP